MVVTEDGGGLAALVVEELGRHGVKARVASEVPPGAGAVIFLGGLREIGSIDDAIAVNREAFRAARAVAARFEAEGGLFVTVQDTGGDFGLSGRAGLRAWSGGLSALARTAALEWPHASVKAIDCERGARSAEAMARAIVEELCTGGVTPEVGLHADGRRTTLALVEAGVAPDARPRIGAGSVVVASGGGRGVTAAGLMALARACRPRIVLLGRTPLPAERDELRGADELALKRAMATKAHAEGRELDPAEISARVARVLAQREIRATLDAIDGGRVAGALPRRRRAGRRRDRAPRSTACGASGGRSPRSSTAPASSPTSASSTRPTSSSTASSTPRSPASAPCSRRRRRDPLDGDLRVLVGRGAHRQPGPVRLRDGQRGAEPRRRRGARAARRGLRRALDRLGAVGGRHGDAGAREALRADGRAAHPAGRRRTHVRRRARRAVAAT